MNLAAHPSDALSLWDSYRQTKDSATKMQLALQYVDIAKFVAKQMRSKATAAIEEDDLVQIGILGIGDAIDHFDDTRGAQFETYAMLRVRWAILDELRKLDWVPRYTRDKYANKLKTPAEKKQQKKIEAAHRIEQQMIAEEESERYGSAMNLFEMMSLQMPVMDKDGSAYTTLGDSLAAPEGDMLTSMLEDEVREEVRRVVDALPKSQGTVLRMHYYQNVDLQDVAKAMGISPSRVSQLHRSAMNTMKEKLRDVIY